MPIDGDIVLKAGLDTSGIKDTLNNLQKTVSRGLKNAIRIGFGVRSIFALIRRLRSDLFEGFGNLAQVYQPFNSAVSQIMNSLNLLKNSFASAFAPIIETVAPIISSFINMIADAVSWVGQFIAVLTGKEYVRAASAPVDYAASLNKSTASSKGATDATKKQTRAAKELQRTLAGFDDVEILHDNRDTDTPTSTSSGGGTGGGVALAPTSIGSAVSQFAKDFMAAWEKADFTDIGRIIGEKLKAALDSIPWDIIKSTLQKVAKSIATFLNGFLETPGLFNSVGRTIAQAINSAVAFAEAFVRNFHWNSLGVAIRDTITSTLTTIEWTPIFNTVRGFGSGLAETLNSTINPQTFGLIGETLRRIIVARLQFLNSFGLTFDFPNFGTSIAEGLNKLLKPQLFRTVAATVMTYLNGALEVLNNFGNQFDFDGFGYSLSEGLNTAIASFNPNLLSGAINKLVNGFTEAVVRFLSNTHWEDFGRKVRELILGIRWEQILRGIGAIIWEAINAAVKFFAGLFDVKNIETPFTDAIKSLQETLSNAVDSIDWDSLSSGINAVVKALAPVADGFGTAFVSVFRGLVDIGIGVLNALGPALQKIADALMSIDPDILEHVGAALGIFTSSLLIINGLHAVVGIIGGVASGIAKFATGATLAGTAAGGAATGMGGISVAGGSLLSILGKLGGGIGAFITASELMKITTGDSTISFDILHSALQSLQDRYPQVTGLTDDLARSMDSIALTEGPEFDQAIQNIETQLEQAGIPASAFKEALRNIIDNSQYQDMDAFIGYIQGIGTASEESTGQTSGLGTSIKNFEGLGLSTPIKMALLSAAIALMGSNGDLSDEQVSTLQQTLDTYNPNKPEKSMERIQTALEETGVSAGTLDQAILQACINADENTKKELPKSITNIKSFGTDLGKEGKSSGKNLNDGLTQGIKDTQRNVTAQAQTTMKNTIDAANKEAGINSPSTKMKASGQYLMDGLRLGIEAGSSRVIDVATDVMKKVTEAIGNSRDFYDIGKASMESFATGISYGTFSVMMEVNNIASSMRNRFTFISWENVGVEAVEGIARGFNRNSGWLSTMAWNAALDMYYSACRALWIHSPSKRFAWVGEMITKGLGEGIVDNQGDAVNAVSNMANALIDEANNANPEIAVNTSVEDWVDSLDDVLTRFSDNVIDKFESLMGTMERLGSLSTIGIPDIALGKVIPSQSSYSSRADNASTIAQALQDLSNDSLTREDLIDVLNSVLPTMFQNYMSFYIGDEQIARHANRGNNVLTRRYNPTTA